MKSLLNRQPLAPIHSLKEIFTEVNIKIDRTRLLRTTNELWKTELGQTFACYHASARLAEQLLGEAGCERIERLAFPADGKTVYQDKTMPLGWRASRGKLVVTQSPVPFADPVVADYERHPFHLIKGSVATPPEGTETRLISEADLHAGADARGALVLLDPETRPSYRTLRDTDILGIVSDHLIGRHETPDAIQWANACTESSSWHTRADEPPRVGYMVSPRIGYRLRAALREGEVRVRAFSDGERYVGEIEAVTGVLPGEDEREIWLLAHLYEPLANDNSSGVAAALEIVHALRALYAEGVLPRPRFTLRLVFAMEAYGFAAFAEKRGGRLRDKVLCAANLDALPILASDRFVELGLSQSGSPSCADYLLEDLMHSGIVPGLDVDSIQTEGLYADDRLLGDSTIGVPTLWVTRAPRSRENGGYLWHNSAQDMSRIEPLGFQTVTALYATWAAALLGLNKENARETLDSAMAISCARLENEPTGSLTMDGKSADWLDYRFEIEVARLKDFSRFIGKSAAVDAAVAVLSDRHRKLKAEVPTAGEREASEDQAWQLASSITITRKTRGLPRDFAAVPKEYRNRVLEPAVTLALVHADGRRSAGELFRRAQWELRQSFSSEQLRDYLGTLQFLAKYGYIDLSCPQAITRTELVSRLRECGIVRGDLVLVHSSLSRLGVVEEGADTVIDALLEAVGETGTLLMPTFTRSFLCFEKGPARNKGLVPFHPERGGVWTGLIAETFRKRPGVIRSRHPSHSIAGLGRRAEECLASHGSLDAPTGPSSPWAKLHELNGKIVFLGASLASCTFLHYLEDAAGMDYLLSSVCVVDDDEKGRHVVTIPRNVPGDRDFYRPRPEESKIFRRIVSRGLTITTKPIGLSELRIIEAAPLYKLGLEALRDDPRILLRDPTP